MWNKYCSPYVGYGCHLVTSQLHSVSFKSVLSIWYLWLVLWSSRINVHCPGTHVHPFAHEIYLACVHRPQICWFWLRMSLLCPFGFSINNQTENAFRTWKFPRLLHQTKKKVNCLWNLKHGHRSSKLSICSHSFRVNGYTLRFKNAITT